MKTINESAVQTGASLEVEVTMGSEVATPVCALACPDSVLLADATIYKAQLRGYNN
jgi:hypothetical protein